MSSAATVIIHNSQFPENVRRDLIQSLRTRQVNPKFHYDSIKQTQKWLALHQRFSPSRNDEDCAAIYDRSFEAASESIAGSRVHLVGLGCGGGEKDTRLLKALKARDKDIFYTPCDVSVAMTLVARKKALSVVAEDNCFPLVCDLATADDLSAVLDKRITHHASRIITFLGMIPNFEPQIILPKLASLVRKKDLLLCSANLAPGKNYFAGMKKILPQYDNEPTRDWLMTCLFDSGVERKDGDLRFTIEDGQFDLKKIVARFHFLRSRRIEIETERFDFHVGDSIQLFFSYRYTPALVRKILREHGLMVFDEWTAKSQEEGVFLCRRAE